MSIALIIGITGLITAGFGVLLIIFYALWGVVWNHDIPEIIMKWGVTLLIIGGMIAICCAPVIHERERACTKTKTTLRTW